MKASIERNLAGTGENFILPFFWQKGQDTQLLREYMHIIHDCSIGAVCVESRPHPDFVGPKWWEDMDAILDEAEKLGMKVWILDDSHFPTGFANGAMRDKPESLCRRGILCGTREVVSTGKTVYVPLSLLPSKEKQPLSKAWVSFMMQLLNSGTNKRKFSPDVILAAVAVSESGETIDVTDCIQDKMLRLTLPAGKWSINLLTLSYNCGAHRDYINMTDPESCRVLIDTVYEPHYQHYARYFGNVIAGFFSDEPELGNGNAYSRNLMGYRQDLPWSDVLKDRLEARLGPDYVKKLPYLWGDWEDKDTAAAVRYAYMDELTSAVQSAFSNPIGAWCREHGVEYIGHVVEDGGGHARTGGALGHYFRGLWGQDMSGIDDIGGQVYPQGEDKAENLPRIQGFMERDGEFFHYELAALAASLAALDEKKKGRAMCEIFGNYGWCEGLELEKYLADHFMVRGINHYVPHAFSPAEYPDPDCPPHFYARGHNPQYKHFGSLMQYMNRICALIDGGVRTAPAAILYHAESEWTGSADMDKKVLRALKDSLLNADIVPADAFEKRSEYHTRIENGSLLVNTQTYNCLIIPRSEYISRTAALAIKELTDSNVPVIFADSLPQGCCDGMDKDELSGCLSGAVTVPTQALPELLYSRGLNEITAAPADNRLRYLRYIKDGELYYFINEGTSVYRGEVTVPSTGNVYIYNAWLNRLEKPTVREENGKTVISLTLEPLQSSLYIFGETPNAPLFTPLYELELKGKAKAFTTPWKRRTCTAACYPFFRDQKSVALPDILSDEMPEFSGFISYENELELPKADFAVFSLPDAHGGVELFVNGVSAGIQAAPPFRFDISALIKPGLNSFRFEVSTTLEREQAAINKSIQGKLYSREKLDDTGVPSVPAVFIG